MYSEQDLQSLYDFLKSTPEAHLKKMMVSGSMTEAHLRVFLKVARSCSKDEFVQYAQTGGLPKIKLSPAEAPLRETLWGVALPMCAQLGLLNVNAKSAKKAA